MTDQNSDDPNYKVGYGKPPLKSRFQKGISGNPRDRKPKIGPSRTKLQQQVDFLAVSEQPITITVNGKQMVVSGYRAAALKLQQKVLSGDKHAMTLYFEMAGKFMDDFTEANPEVTGMVENLYRSRMMQSDPPGPETVKDLNKLHKKTRGD